MNSAVLFKAADQFLKYRSFHTNVLCTSVILILSCFADALIKTCFLAANKVRSLDASI